MAEIIFTLEETLADYIVLGLKIAGEGSKRRLYRDRLRAIFKQKEMIEKLMRFELSYRGILPSSDQADTTPFNRVRVPRAHARPILEALGLFVEKKEAEVVVEAPLPVLILHDRSGAFADLFFAYGMKGEVACYDPVKRPFRNPAEEKRWEDDLKEAGYLEKMCDGAHYFCPLDRVSETLAFLIELGWTVRDKEGREVHLLTQEAVTFVEEGNEVFLQGDIAFGEESASIDRFLMAHRQKEPFLPLGPKSVGLLDHKKLEERWGGVTLRMPRSHLGLLRKETALTDQLPSPQFRGTLRPFQKDGLSWLLFLKEAGFHGLLADEMGLGKTVQVVAFFSRIDAKRPHLVVMPTSLLFNWRKEFETFLPECTPYIHSGPGRSTSLDVLAKEQVILTSYSILRLDQDLFRQIEFETVVIDEAQTIKNPDAQVTQAVNTLNARFRLALSGTPIENRYDDLWSLFHFLEPTLFGARALFCKQMQRPSFRKIVQKKLGPFTLQRTKEAVAKDLPPKIEQTVLVEMDPEQRQFYDTFLENNKKDLPDKKRIEILEIILRLRQICCHPELVDPETTRPSAKLQQLLIDVEEVVSRGHKVIVFSQFTKVLRRIEQELSHPYLTLDGTTKNREEIVERFNNDPAIPIFLCSLKAGGVGLNLQVADYVFLFDPWWNEAVERQAIDRAHRLGRKGALIAKRYVTPFTVEEKMMEIKKAKAQMGLGLMECDQALQALTTQDLLELLDYSSIAPVN